ncbi:hypothetical protein VW35_18525, partial [Devosia soli]
FAYNFQSAGAGINNTANAGDNAKRPLEVTKPYGRKVGAYTLLMVIDDRTDEMAFEKWEHYKKGTDLEAIAWSRDQAIASRSVPFL